MDITQARVCTMICMVCKINTRCMLVNILISVNSLLTESECKNGMTDLSASDAHGPLKKINIKRVVLKIVA